MAKRLPAAAVFVQAGKGGTRQRSSRRDDEAACEVFGGSGCRRDRRDHDRRKVLCERGGGAAACTRVEGGACGRGRARYLRRLNVEDTPNGEEADSGSGRVPIGDDSKVGDDLDRWVPCISGSKGRGGTLHARAGLAVGPRPSSPGRREKERACSAWRAGLGYLLGQKRKE